MSLTAERLRELLDYNHETGEFTWKHGARWGGKVAGHYNKVVGHVYVNISKRLYKAHRLVWLYVYGEWPSSEIDHRDGNGANNRLYNLRLATRQQNMGNTKCRRDSTCGVKGVHRLPGGTWRAVIAHRHIGCFPTADEASAAYMAAAQKRYGEFARAI
jgi:hypothetical protein